MATYNFRTSSSDDEDETDKGRAVRDEVYMVEDSALLSSIDMVLLRPTMLPREMVAKVSIMSDRWSPRSRSSQKYCFESAEPCPVYVYAYTELFTSMSTNMTVARRIVATAEAKAESRPCASR